MAELLKSVCGADLFVQLTNGHGNPATDTLRSSLFLQVNLIDSRAYHGVGADCTATDSLLESCTLRENKADKPLLTSNDEGHTLGHSVIIPMTYSKVPLSKLYITDSSEALMAGRKPPMQLVVRVVNAQHQVISSIPPLLSEAFVVTTIRSSARKPDIPFITDLVHKLEAVGKETVAKLRDVQAAAKASSNASDAATLQDFTDRMCHIETVGDFSKLVHWCEESPERTRSCQRVLKFVRGWDTAAAHAKRAVSEDSWPRMFSIEPAMTLVYACKHGKVDMTKILGCGQTVPAVDGADAQLTAITDVERHDQDLVLALRKQAQRQWHETGHPGWQLVPASTRIETLLPQKLAGSLSLGDPMASSSAMTHPWSLSAPSSEAANASASAADHRYDVPGSSSDDSNGRKRSRHQVEDSHMLLKQHTGQSTFNAVQEHTESWPETEPNGLIPAATPEATYLPAPFTHFTGLHIGRGSPNAAAADRLRAIQHPHVPATVPPAEALQALRHLQDALPQGQINAAAEIPQPILAASDAYSPKRVRKFKPPVTPTTMWHSRADYTPPLRLPESHQTPTIGLNAHHSVARAQELSPEADPFYDASGLGFASSTDLFKPLSFLPEITPQPVPSLWPPSPSEMMQEFPDPVQRPWQNVWQNAHKELLYAAPAQSPSWLEQPFPRLTDGRELTRLDSEQAWDAVQAGAFV